MDSAIAGNSVDLSDYYTRSQSDSRYFLQNASPGNVSLARDNVTPPQVRGLAPRSPLGSNVLFSGTVLELTCDAYTKSEADGRYVQSNNLASLDSRYFPANGNNGGGGILPMVITKLTPRMIRAILPRPPLSGALILGNAGTLELNCDCYSKSESDGRYYTRGQADAAFASFSTETGLQNLNLQVIDIDSRVTTLEGSPLPADISVNSVSATGDWLTLVGGSSGTRIQDNENNTLFSMTTAEAFFGVRTRVDWRLTIDTPSGSDEGLYTAAVRARALEITGIATGTEAVFPTSAATAQLQPSPSTNAYTRIFTGVTGLEVSDQSLNPLLQVEDDETKSYSRLISALEAWWGPFSRTLQAAAGRKQLHRPCPAGSSKRWRMHS